MACGLQARLRLLHGADVLDLRETRDRLRLCIDHDARRDVVEDDRPVGRGRDRLDVRHDAALRRPVVVRRDDEEAVDAERVRPLGEVDRVRRRVGPGARDHSAAVPDRVDCGLVERHPLVVRERRRLTRGTRDDDAVGAVLEQELAQRAKRVEVDRVVLAERRHDSGQDLAEHSAGLYSPGIRPRITRARPRAAPATRAGERPARPSGRAVATGPPRWRGARPGRRPLGTSCRGGS